jgi:hypothetical protein
MKTTTLILAAVLALQVNILFAGNDVASAPATNSYSSVSLAPVTPTEATFEESIVTEMNALMPVTPTEATFEDAAPEMVSITALAPAPPAEADFGDAVLQMPSNTDSLAPVSPPEADFE